jgi:hypothetical protein
MSTKKGTEIIFINSYNGGVIKLYPSKTRKLKQKYIYAQQKKYPTDY